MVANKTLQRLVAKRWLQRLERGTYQLVPMEAGPEVQWAEHEYLIAAALIQPYYLAYATALNYYGYSERLARPIWVATTQRKRITTHGGMELLRIGDEPLLGRLEEPAGRSYRRLEPNGPPEGPRVARWRIIVNIPERQLLEWREH